jgi:hypothetical protein
VGTLRYRGALLLVATAALWLCFGPHPARGQDPGPLAPVAFLAGGTWYGAGTWPDGSALRVEQRFFWGPTKRILHFEAYNLASGTRTLLYEGLMFFDAARGKIVQWNFKPTGERDELEVSQVNADGYEVRSPNTWSIIRTTAADAFQWELRIPQAGDWNVILDAKYRREP